MYRNVIKPIFDFLLALIALPFCLILFIPVAIAVKIGDKGPVFYCGKRIGKNGKLFRMIKFRTMKVDAPDIRLSDGSTYNAEDDDRVTKVGRFLRKTSIDELPQIFNILAFQMSFIGPRPDPADWLDKYPEDEREFLKLRPGITGYSQAYFRNSVDGYQKIRNDNYYARHISLWTDIKIFFKTIQTVLKRDNVFVDEERSESLAGKRILIVGAGILQVPMIKKAKEMGLYVGVADYDPEAVGVRLADEYFDCSTIDKDGLLEAANRFEPDGIVTTATDMPMRAVSYVCSQSELPSIGEDCALKCTDKIEMIKCFTEHEVPSPRFAEAETEEEVKAAADYVGIPCIMKPADNSGSRGVVLCEKGEDCLLNYEYVKSASRGGKILVEEYMRGDEVSVEVFVENGTAHVLQITDKFTTGSPHFVESGHVQPSKYVASMGDAVAAVAQAACGSVGLENGPAHLEMIFTESGPKMVEMGARMGGDCITSHLVPLSTGIDMTEQTIRYALGAPLDLRRKIDKAAAVTFLTAKSGTIEKISHVKRAYRVSGVTDIGFFKRVGDESGDIHSSSDRIGYVVARHNTPKKALAACKKAAKRIKIRVAEA